MSNKLKYYLRGLGTGILITTIVLSLSYSLSGKRVSKEETTTYASVRESLSEKASSNLESSKKEKDSTEETEQPTKRKKKKHTTEDSSKDSQEETTEQSSEEMTETNSEETTEETSVENDTEPAPEETTKDAEQTPADGQTVTLIIESGSTSDVVAANLKNFGVIEDAYDFDLYLHNSGYEVRIQAGSFEIPITADYETIARIITRS